MPAYCITHHRALTHQKLPRPLQHQGGLLLLGLDRNKPHRWPRYRLEDRGGIIRIILAAFEIGLLHSSAVWPRACNSRPQ
jgi:hypothetical protein